jgi:purine-binding chemotaxis protein CheW
MEEILLDENVDTQKDKYLTFIIADETYAVPIGFITEIVGIQKVTAVPNVNEYIKGVINLRGLVIPVVDLRSRFGLEEIEYNDRTCIIVVKQNDIQVGVIVDIVREVLNIPEASISAPPKINSGPLAEYINGMGRLDSEVIIMLDLCKLLFESEMKNAL